MSSWSREIRKGAIQLCLLAALPGWFIRREAGWL
jgi:hypothetical protein